MADCLFCKIATGEISTDKVYEDDTYVAFTDINPQAPTHILIIPKRHISQIAEMRPDDAAVIGGLFSLAAQICAERALTDYRLVINNGEGAGQTMFHIHLHVLAGRQMGWPPG